MVGSSAAARCTMALVLSITRTPNVAPQLCGNALLAASGQPPPQHFLHLDHRDLPIRHPPPSRIRPVAGAQGLSCQSRKGEMLVNNSPRRGGNACEKKPAQGAPMLVKIYNRLRRFSPPLRRAALRKLLLLDAAESLGDLRVPPRNRLEKLSGDRQGQHSIRISESMTS